MTQYIPMDLIIYFHPKYLLDPIEDWIEFYDLYYSYANDCLEAAIACDKSYYIDSDLKPEKQLLFSLTIIPFGKVNTPGIN